MLKVEVRYNECDVTGYAYNGNYFPWMHLGISYYKRECGLDPAVFGNKQCSLMTVHQSFDYMAPVTYHEEIEIKMCLTKVGDSTLTFQCEILRGETLVGVGKHISCFMNLAEKKKVSFTSEVKEQLVKLVGTKL